MISRPINAKPPAKIAPAVEFGVACGADKNFSMRAPPIPAKARPKKNRKAAASFELVLMRAIMWLVLVNAGSCWSLGEYRSNRARFDSGGRIDGSTQGNSWRRENPDKGWKSTRGWKLPTFSRG